MGRPRKHPRRAFRCTETFGGNDPETGNHIGAHKGDVWIEGRDPVHKALMYFEPVDDDLYSIPEEVEKEVG